MYRNQQQQHQPYSNQVPAQSLPKKLENPLFEDSPDMNQRTFGLHFGKDPYPRFQETQYYPPPNQQPPNMASSQNLRRQYHTPLTNNYMMHQQQQQLPVTNFQNSTVPRVAQSEESGGVVGTQEGRGESDDYEEEDEFEEREDMKDDENDIEYIIMNLYSKMKNLENKYIDLANYYKHELVKTSTSRSQHPGEDMEEAHSGLPQQRSSYQGQTLGGRQQIEVDQSPGRDSSGGKKQGEHLPSERQIINELIEEKKRLEEDMKQMIALRSSVISSQNHQQYQQQHQQSPAKIKEFKTNIPSQQQLKFLNEQLKGTLQDVYEEMDSVQKKHLMQFLSAKQNEMYQLATKYNLPAQAKNESLGLWYDAKTKTTQVMSDLKTFLQEKQKSISNNFISSKINTERAEDNTYSQQNVGGVESETLQAQLEILSKGQNTNTNKMLEDFRKEILSLKKKQEQHQKQGQRLKQQLKFKEGLIKDEQQRMTQLIRDIKQGLSGADRGLILSGEKGHHNNSGIGALSPFEKKIATYQKSAEMRKTTNERSGSRGRLPMSNTGTNFYPSQYRHDNLTNPQILAQQPQSNLDEVDARQIKQKTKLLEAHLDELGNKILLKNQDVLDLEHTLDACCLDQARHIQALDNLLLYHAQSTKQLEQKQRSKSKLGYEPFTTSPAANNYQAGKEQEKRLTDLQRNYDQIYQDLRKANEKYLNQKVENTKLKDEVQILSNALDDAQQQIRRLQSTVAPNTPGDSRKIQPKTRQSRHDPMARDNQQQPQRNSSNSSAQLTRENDDLRKRVQELEKECFALTYYQQELQRRGTNQNSLDPFVRGLQNENMEVKNKIDQLCIQVQKFMLSMRRLQRAVNNKDKDIQNLKAEFEKNKKVLDQMVKEIKERDEQARIQNSNSVGRSLGNIPGNNLSVFSNGQQHLQQNHSMLVGGHAAQRTEGSQERPRNRSALGHLASSNRPVYPSSQREDLNSSNSQLPPKRGVIRPKINAHETQEQQNDVQTSSFQDQDRFNSLLEEVKNINEERERLKKQIDELKNQNEDAMVDKNALEAKLNSKNQSTQRLTQQLKQASDRIYKLEQLLSEYKDGLYSLETSLPSGQQHQVRTMKNDLVFKERDLQSDREVREKQASIGLGRQSLHVQTDGVLVDPEQLRSELLSQIQDQEQNLEYQLDQLDAKLNEKEEDLNGVKKLLVNRLKEIESSFVEISQDMIEHDQVQQEASKAIQQKQLQNQSKIQSQNQQQRDLERSLEQVVADGTDQRYDEELEHQVEELNKLTEQLQTENQDLKVMLRQLQKDLQAQEGLLIIKANYEEIQEINSRLEERVKDLQTELSIQKRQGNLTKQTADKYKAELSEAQKQRERQASLHQQQLQDLEDQLLHRQQLLTQEQESRILFQSEHASKERQIKQAKSEKQQAQQECDRVMAMMEGLENENQQLQAELDLIKNLRKEGDDLTSQSEGSEEEELKKINDNPREAAVQNLRLLKATQKELKIIKNQFDKLQLNYDELKQKFDQLKQESRTNVEEIMSMETRIFDLESENEKLKKDTTQSEADSRVIREQEELFRQRLAFKDSEIEEMATKMSRIVQNNIELTNKCSRLESANLELSTENELTRNKLQSIELELEMTKDNNERDVESLQQQRAEIEGQLKQQQEISEDLNQQIKEIQSQHTLEKLQLQQEIQKLKTQYQSLLQKEEESSNDVLQRLRNQVQQQENELTKKDRQQRLVCCLQLHVQRSIEAELNRVLEDQKKRHRERRLIEVLQMKARESIIQLLEQETQERVQDQYEASLKLQQITSQKDQEVAQAKSRSSAEINILQTQFLAKQQKDQKQTAEEYELRLTKQREEQDAKRRQQQEELERLKKEQIELVKSLTQQQDQQTRDLIAQKERENQKLTEDLVKLQEDLAQKYQRQLEEKETQSKKVSAQQEKIIKDLEHKLEAAVTEKKQILHDGEQELSKLRQESEIQLKTLEQRSKDEQEKQLKKIQESEKRLKDKDLEILKAKEEHERVLESLNKKKLDEIKRLQLELEQSRDHVREQEQSVHEKELLCETKDTEIKRLQKDIQRVVKEEQAKSKSALDQQIQQHEERLKALEHQQASEAQSYENQLKQLQSQIKEQNLKTQQQLKQRELEVEQLKTDHQLAISQLETQSNHELQELRKKLEDEHQVSAKKKDAEISILEKMQEKIRQDLGQKLDQKETERRDQERRAKELEVEIARKEKEIDRERNEQMEMIAELNEKLDEQTKDNVRLTQQIDDLKKELQNLRKQSQESESQQIRELSDQVTTLEAQKKTLMQEKKKADIELESLVKQLKQKEEDAINLENDLTEAYSQMDEERNTSREEIARLKAEHSKAIEELSQSNQKKEKDRKDLEMQLKLKDNQITQLGEDIEEGQRLIEEKKAELQAETERCQKQKTKVKELQQQVQNIKQQYEEEIEQMNQEILILKQEIDGLKRKYEQTATLDSDRSLDNVNKFMDLNRKLQETSSKLMEQIQRCHELETENDTLKRAIQEQEYSFAKGNAMGGVQAKPDSFVDLNASSIENKDGDDDFESAGNRNYKEDVKRLETEMEEFHKIHVALENQNQSLKTELNQIKSATQNFSQQEAQEAKEALENVKHLKSLFIKYLEKIPIAQEIVMFNTLNRPPGVGGEELLPVLFSMMNVTDNERKQLVLVRQQLTEKKVTEDVKKGLMGGFFGKKK